ncbi:MAG: class I SAM-dependent RNA methyltransferase [Candidatus Dormibacteraceae bacterium]
MEPSRAGDQLVRLRAEGPVHGGAVIAHHEGRVVMLELALPGELVEASWRGRQGGVSRARAEHVLEPAPGRVAAPCPHFGACGGCQWQHALYARELELKERVVADAWERQGLRLPPGTPVLGMEEPWRYRIRGEFEAIHPGPGAEFRFGFHRSRSRSLLPIHTCPIHDLRIERALEAFRVTVAEMEAPGLQTLRLTVEPTGPGLLWRARFREGKGHLAPGFAARVADRLPELVLLEESMSLDFWGLSFRVRSDSFVQTNHRQMLVLYRVALDMLAAGPGDSVLDLYAGIGTLSVAVARSAGEVVAVEEHPGSVALNRLNARINGAPGLRVLPGRVEDVLRGVRVGRHTTAILDPPRAGCEVAAVAELIRLGLPRVVYISCDPVTHARDIAALVRGGYRVRRVALVDMFPQTYHVESVALLERSAG